MSIFSCFCPGLPEGTQVHTFDESGKWKVVTLVKKVERLQIPPPPQLPPKYKPKITFPSELINHPFEVPQQENSISGPYLSIFSRNVVEISSSVTE